MPKCIPDAVFNYQEWAGVHIIKLTYSNNPFCAGVQCTKLQEVQEKKIAQCKVGGYEMINGFVAYGKVFSDPNDNSSGVHLPEANVIIMASRGHKGAIAVLPTGEVLALTSKSWKPTVKHFAI